MLRKGFVQELQRLEDEVVVLGSIVANAILDSVWVLRQPDGDEARRLIAGDREINCRRFSIEDGALTLIATQQPMARDLRVVAAVLEISTELERIGDYAKGNARISLVIGEDPPAEPLLYLPEMAEKTVTMLHLALRAFARRDAALARDISRADDEVDDLYYRIYSDLVQRVVTERSSVHQANYLMWAAHNLERSADRVVNICERVVFTVSGVMTEMDQDEAFLQGSLVSVT